MCSLRATVKCCYLISVLLLQISCNALIVVGALASVTLSEDDINNMPDTEIADCVEIFGKMNLEKNLQNSIWRRLYKVSKMFNSLNSMAKIFKKVIIHQ